MHSQGRESKGFRLFVYTVFPMALQRLDLARGRDEIPTGFA